MAFKVLHSLLVLLRRSFCLKRAEISSFTRLRIFLAGIQPILAGFQLPDHAPLNIRAGSRLRALNCGQPPNAFAVAELSGRRPPSPRLRCAREPLPYICLAKRFENQSASSAVRIPRLVARCAGKLQCWLA